jgi:hypothetical protein
MAGRPGTKRRPVTDLGLVILARERRSEPAVARGVGSGRVHNGEPTMQRKHLLPAVVAAALGFWGAGAAQAQQAGTAAPGVTGLHEAEDEAVTVPPFNLTVDQIEDMNLAAIGGDEIGEIDEVLVDSTGKPVAVAAEVGGFLGIGDKAVVIGLDQLQVENERLVTGMTKEQIEALPAWEN